jgi:hypothetical protein
MLLSQFPTQYYTIIIFFGSSGFQVAKGFMLRTPQWK